MRRSPPSFSVLLVPALALAPSIARAQMPGRGAEPAPAPTGTSPGAAPPAPAAAIALPVVKKNDGAVYPKQAIDEGVNDVVHVTVLLDVDATGHVTNAVVETPAGHGFDEAAVAAAHELEFDPAIRVDPVTHAGKPVAVKRLPFTYTFAPPAPPPSALSGRVVTLAAERPIEGAAVEVRDATGTSRTVTTDATGAWRLDGLAAGTYHVTIRATGRVTHEADETVQPNEEATTVDRLAPEVEAPTQPAAPAEDVQEVEVQGEKPPRSRSRSARSISARSAASPGPTATRCVRCRTCRAWRARRGSRACSSCAARPLRTTQYFVDGTPVPHRLPLRRPLLGRADGDDQPPRLLSRQLQRAVRARHGRHRRRRPDHAREPTGSTAWRRSNLIDSRVLAQGPIFDTGWRFAVAGRRSYLDLWLGPVLKAARLERERQRPSTTTTRRCWSATSASIEPSASRSSGRTTRWRSCSTRACRRASPSSREASSTHTGFWRAAGALHGPRLEREHRASRDRGRDRPGLRSTFTPATSSSTSYDYADHVARRAGAEARLRS